MLREIPLLGEMSRSDKRVAAFARKRWHGIYAVTEGADVSDTTNISIIIKHSITTVGADPCEIPLIGEMGEAQKGCRPATDARENRTNVYAEKFDRISHFYCTPSGAHMGAPLQLLRKNNDIGNAAL